jgi:enamine deaminase RidA (YjgF/YER057c/UK114 family)
MFEARIAELGLTIPTVPAPLAAYVPAVRTGNYVYTSGQLPFLNGELIATGLVHAEVDIDTAVLCARQSALNALAAIKTVVDSLDEIEQIVKVVGFVASPHDFSQHPMIVNGASQLLGEIFGDAGKHARSAVGVSSLPMNAPVELEMVIALKVRN